MSPESVAQVLRHLPKSEDPRLIVGPSTLDDAGVFRLDDETALVQTVDVFSPIVDDPYDFGRIVAANSLSDAYAMGARPLTVMNIACFPAELDTSVLADILRGSGDTVAKTGAATIGGHTMYDTEVKFGLAVTALAHPDKLMTNSAAAAGDLLVLTKPLGTGLAGTAIKKQKADPGLAARIVPVMTRLNRAAAEAMQNAGVTACTDVTGFGLLGHAAELAESSNVTLRVRSGDVPLIDGTLALAEQDLFPAGSVSNRDYARKWTRIRDDVAPLVFEILTDAQTSGGLLAAVSADRADELLERLRSAGDTDSTIIGEVVERSNGCNILLDP